MDFRLSDEQAAFQGECAIERYRRVHRILEGTNEIMRLIIARKLLGSIG